MDIREINKLLNEAEVFEKLEDYSSAERVYDDILKEEKMRPRVFAFRGYSRFCQGRFLDAVEDFSSALHLKPDAPSTLFFRARSLESLGRVDEALIDYTRSAELYPSADVFMNIGLILRYKGKDCESDSFFEKALELDPENETIRNLLIQK